MKITIENTSKIVNVDGVPARIWEGQTPTGIPVHCYITRIAVPLGRDQKDYEQFERELQETKAPSPDVAGLPLRMIL